MTPVAVSDAGAGSGPPPDEATNDANVMIRAFDPTGDQSFLRKCVLELQAVEREIDAGLPAGEEMVDAYCALLFERVRAWEGAIFVAEESGVPAGLVSVYARVPGTEPDEAAGPYALLNDLVVLPAHRRRGIASRLLQQAEEFARGCGAHLIRLEVMAGNGPARDLYLRVGWKDRVVEMEKALR